MATVPRRPPDTLRRRPPERTIQNTRDAHERIAREVAAYRAKVGLPPDPASDAIWVRRISGGTHSIRDAHSRILEKARQKGRGGRGGGQREEEEQFDFRRAALALFPWIPAPLLNVFIRAWEETGSPDVALGEMRRSPVYDQFFPGNRREDGTVRLTEQQYLAGREAFALELTSYAIPPNLLGHLYPQLVTAGISPDQFRRRMADAFTNIASNLTEVRRWYADHFGAGDVSLGALMASVLDPSTNPLVFEERFRKAQIGGEAKVFGFNVNLAEVSRLASFGLNQQAARSFFGQARGLLPTLGELVRRHNDPRDPFDLSMLGEALILGDPDHQRRMQQLFAAEQSLYSPFNLYRMGQEGQVLGLRQR